MINKKSKNKPKRLSTLVIALLIAGFLAPLATVAASNQISYTNNTNSSQNITNTALSATPTGNENGTDQGTQADDGGNKGTTSNSTQNPNQTTNVQASGTTSGSTLDNGNMKQYNKTNITPKGETEQVQAREQTRFQYRNMTIVMNCTRNCTVSFTVDEEVTPKDFSLSVDPNQAMTLAMNLSKSPLNGAMVNERCLNFYLGIEPNATLQLQAQIRLYINQTELNHSMNREVNASRLTWMYWNQTQARWEAVESSMDQNGYLVCNTNHFSTWTVAELEQTAETVTPSTQNGVSNLEYAGLGAVIAAVVIVLGIAAYKRRK